MAKKKTHEVLGRFFRWRLRNREGVWQADGRSNSVNLGRHSLGTRDLQEATKLVHELDAQKAVELGLAHPRLLDKSTKGLDFTAGLESFGVHMNRPKVAKGLAPSTKERYGRINRRIAEFAIVQELKLWEQVDKTVLNSYANWRSKRCKMTTIATERTHFHGIHRYLISTGELARDCDFDYPIKLSKQSSRYCPSSVEVRSVLAQLVDVPEHRWLYNVVSMLAHTGTRFAELALLTWDDIDWDEGVIYILDESMQNESKSTKSGYSREVPIHDTVGKLLDSLPRRRGAQILQGPRGGKLRSDTFGKHLRKFALAPLADQFGKKFQTITAHCFRHFFASWCAGRGISQQTVMDWMGHRTESMAAYYFHRDRSASRENMKRLGSI